MLNRKELEQLGDRIAEHAAHLDAATHRLLTDVRTFDQAGGWFKQGAKSCAEWLSWRVGWDATTAREHVRVANKLGSLPLIDDALRRGELSYSKVRAMTRVATPANEAMLLDQARYSTGAQLDQICRKYATVRRHDDNTRPHDDQQRRWVKRRDMADGMVRIEAMLHPEEAACVWAALERIAAERCRDHKGENDNSSSVAPATCEAGSSGASAEAGSGASAETGSGASAEACRDAASAHEPASRSALTRPSDDDLPVAPAKPHLRAFDRAEALVLMAEEVLRGTSRERAPIDLIVTVTAQELRTAGESEATAVGVVADGTCVSAAAVRRMACDCGVVEVIEDERGVPLSIGRKRRTIPAPMKRALLARDRTCRFPGCRTRVFLQGHHVEHWADGGHTALRNIVCLCGFHHRHVHEYGYKVRRTADHEWLFFDPRGNLVPDTPTPPAVIDAGWPAILEANASLEITSETPACGWDGNRVDYAAAVDALIHADGRVDHDAVANRTSTVEGHVSADTRVGVDGSRVTAVDAVPGDRVHLVN